jgi:hypothetical protein
MAKKQLKKLNQPKKYLQGGSNMSSVAQMKQNPYYLGQVEAGTAEDQFQKSQNQLAQARLDAAQAQKEATEESNQQLDATVRSGAANMVKAVATDQKAGNLGRFMLPPVTTAAPATAVNLGPGIVNPTTGKALTMTLGKTTGGTQGVNFSNLASQGATVAGEGAGVTGRVGMMGSNMSAVGAGAIGVAANIGGKIIQKRADDNSAFTATNQEALGNVGGGALASAGTGFGIGATVGSFVPVVGNVVGGLIGAGIGAGVGALKARKENKAAEEEAQRLQREQAAIRGALQGAFVNSRLGTLNQGFGYASDNVGNSATTQYQVAKTGGVKKIPGGKIVPIEGTDAVEYVGRSHEEGGMFPEAKKVGGKIKDKGSIEVEGGETEDQVIMEDNNTRDYIFSKYLKLGGKSFAQRHKEILKGSGSQDEIQQLASMQEKVAGRNPQQIAMYGGIHKYVDGGVTDPPQNIPGSGSYQQVGKFGAPDLTNAKLVTVNGPSGSRYQVYQFPDGSTYDPNNMNQKIQSVKKEGAETEGALFAAPGAIAQGVTSGLAGAARLGYNMINDKALPSGSSGSAGALPAGNTSAVGNYGGNVFAAKPPSESFNVFGNYPAMIKQAGALSASGAQPQGSSSASYASPTGQGEGQQYFNNVGQSQGQGQNQSQGQGQSDPYNTAENAKAMGWGNDVEGYIRSEFGFGPNYKAPSTPSKGSTKKSKPAYDREAWRKQGVGLMTDEELAVAGPQDTIPDGAQYRRPPGATPPPVAGGQGVPPANITGTFRDNGDGTFSYGSDQAGWETSMDKNVAKSKFQTNQLKAAGAQTAPQGSAPYMAPSGVAGSAPNAQAGPVSTAGQTIVAGNPPSTAPAGTQSAVSSQTVAGAGTPAAGTTVTGTPTAGTQPTAGADRFYGKGDEGQKGRSVAIEKVPQGQKQKDGYYGSASENDFQSMIANNPWFDFTSFNPKNKTDVSRFQTEFNKRVGQGFTLKVDGKLGEQTRTAALYMNDPAMPQTPPSTTSGTTPSGETPETPTEKNKQKEPCGPGTYLSSDGSCQPVPPFKQGRGIDGSMAAGFGQLVPVGAALFNPYKIAPGIVGAPAIKGPLMPRMNMNQERASAIQQNVAYKNAVVNQNAGPASLAILGAANTKTNEQMLAIGKQEQDANKQLAAQEGSLAMEASKFTADTDQKRQMFNREFNKDERRYRREDILGALDTAASRIAGIFKDKKSYEAQERLARALDETKSYDRFSIYEQLTKQANQKNSPYYGVPDAELRRMAAGISEQIYGDMGIVAEAPGTAPAKTGGVRQYISRLGELKSARATKAKL